MKTPSKTPTYDKIMNRISNPGTIEEKEDGLHLTIDPGIIPTPEESEKAWKEVKDFFDMNMPGWNK